MWPLDAAPSAKEKAILNCLSKYSVISNPAFVEPVSSIYQGTVTGAAWLQIAKQTLRSRQPSSYGIVTNTPEVVEGWYKSTLLDKEYIKLIYGAQSTKEVKVDLYIVGATKGVTNPCICGTVHYGGHTYSGSEFGSGIFLHSKGMINAYARKGVFTVFPGAGTEFTWYGNSYTISGATQDGSMVLHLQLRWDGIMWNVDFMGWCKQEWPYLGEETLLGMQLHGVEEAAHSIMNDSEEDTEYVSSQLEIVIIPCRYSATYDHSNIIGANNADADHGDFYIYEKTRT